MNRIDYKIRRHPVRCCFRVSAFLCLTLLVAVDLPGKSPEPNSLGRVSVENERAREMLEKANRRVEKGYPNEATKLYLKGLKAFPKATIHTSGNRYVSLSEYLRKKMSSWSPKRLSWFRDYVRGEAKSLYRRAKKKRSARLLHRVAERFFFTSSGRRAAVEIARQGFKEANFSTAAYWWRQLLKYHPDPGLSEEHLLIRILTAYRYGGTPEPFRRYRERVKARIDSLPEAERERVRTLLSKSFPDGHAERNLRGDWPRPGGNRRGRGRVRSELERYRFDSKPVVEGEDLLLLWTYPSGGLPTGEGPDALLRTLSDPVQPDLNRGVLSDEYTYVPFDPIVYHDRLYVHDGASVFAFDLDQDIRSEHRSDRKLLMSFPDRKQKFSRSSINSLYEKDLGLKSLTADGGSIYFTLKNRLYRVDERLTRRSFKPVAPPTKDEDRLTFNGTPLVTENGIFVPMVREYNGQTEIYLGCFDRTSGELKWNRFLGVSFLNVNGGRRDDRTYARKYAHLLMKNHRILVASNMGLVSSVHEVSGRINWVHDYSEYGMQPPDDRNEGPSWTPTKHSPRGLQPPHIRDGVLYVLPWDSPLLLGFDLDTGRKVFSYRAPDAGRFYEVGSASKSKKEAPSPYAFLYDHRKEKFFTKNFGVVAVNLSDSDDRPMFRDLVRMDRYIPSFSPGEQHMIFGGESGLVNIRRSIFYSNYVTPWPGGAKLQPHRMLSIGPRTILVGPGGVAVMTGARSFLKRKKGASDSPERKELMGVLRTLALNGRAARLARVLEKWIRSGRMVSSERARWRRLYRLSVLRALKRGRGNENWKRVESVARGALEAFDDEPSTYVRIFTALDQSLFQRTKYRALLQLYSRMVKEGRLPAPSDRVSVPAGDPGDRMFLELLIDLRLRYLRRNRPEIFRSAPEALLDRFFSRVPPAGNGGND